MWIQVMVPTLAMLLLTMVIRAGLVAYNRSAVHSKYSSRRSGLIGIISAELDVGTRVYCLHRECYFGYVLFWLDDITIAND